MRVALTGVSGFIGSVVSRHLVEGGHTVTGLVRANSRRDHIRAYVDRFVVGDQADARVWGELLDGAECVIHNSVDWSVLRAPVRLDDHLERNLSASIRLLHASAPRQFIFMSTIAVHHDMLPRWGGVIDEDHPLRPSMLYGAYKAAVEDHLWAEHFGSGRQTCALRPCGVYGVDPAIDRSHGHDLLLKISGGEAVTKTGGGKFVHVEDVAAATAACVGNPECSGKVFNLVDCYARWADWALMACELLGKDVHVDVSSPSQPKNMFDKRAAQRLGVGLDRGHVGIADHLRELAERMELL